MVLSILLLLAIWTSPAPRNMVICAAPSTPAAEAVADWSLALWAPGARTFYLGCIDPDITVLYTTPEETMLHCGGNDKGCTHFSTMTIYGTTRAILSHELGHAFGLTHTNADGLCTPSIMTDVGCPMYITPADREHVLALIPPPRP